MNAQEELTKLRLQIDALENAIGDDRIKADDEVETIISGLREYCNQLEEIL